MREKKIKNIDLKDVIIKKATLSDFDFFCKIRSEYNVIYWSGFKGKPDYKGLKRWYELILFKKKVFKDKDRMIYIIYCLGEKAGFFYVDKLKLRKNLIEISIAVSEKFQGKGLGGKAIKKLIEIIKEEKKEYNQPEIIAWIFDINVASRRIFTKNGFLPTAKTKRKSIRLEKSKELMRKYVYSKNSPKNKPALEIGSFFSMPDFDCRDEKKSALHYLSSTSNSHSFFGDGRQAIKAALLKNFKKIKNKDCYLPAYLCPSILQPFKELKLRINFYKHSPFLRPLITDDLKNSLIFIVDYFGTELVSKEKLSDFLKKGNIVILDVTHSVLDKKRLNLKRKNLYLIASLRKIFPIPDGGILYYSFPQFKIKKLPAQDHETILKAMRLKNFYLKEGPKIGLNKVKNVKDSFLKIYRKYEKNKDDNLIKLKEIPAISLDILKNLDILNIIKKRKENLGFLSKNLSEKKYFLFDKKQIKSPFFFPLVFKDEKQREAVKKNLIKNNIYPPVHWQLPELLQQNYLFEKNLSKRILSLPIDQRYDEENLSKTADIINDVINEKK